MRKLSAALTLTAAVTSTWATAQTVTLSMLGMTHASCSIIVKCAPSKIGGVNKTDTSFDRRQAVITFDDARTSVQKLTKATEGAGYPPSLKRQSINRTQE